VSLAVQLVDGGGEGPAVVLGHGLTMDGHSVERLAAGLRASGHRTVTWELPGHGAAEPADVGWSVEALGAALARAVGDAGLERPALVGVSMGGYASLQAAGGPSALDVDGLVLIGCGGAPAPPPGAERLGSLATWAAGSALPREAAEAMAAAELGDRHPGAVELRDRWLADDRAGARYLPGYLALFTRPDPAVAAAAVHARALVVRGAADPWVTEADAALLASLLRTRSVEVPGAAHQPQHTRPEFVLEAVVAALAR
jgi:pimeloyl-ACP methyl ester carboxylesterase